MIRTNFDLSIALFSQNNTVKEGNEGRMEVADRLREFARNF